MKYYMVVELDITDPSWIPEYAEKVTKLVEKNGGRYLARTSQLAMIEGERKLPQLLGIIEWPSKAVAEACYASEEYRPFREKRQAGSKTELILVAGEDITKTAKIAE